MMSNIPYLEVLNSPFRLVHITSSGDQDYIILSPQKGVSLQFYDRLNISWEHRLLINEHICMYYIRNHGNYITIVHDELLYQDVVKIEIAFEI